jgi:hypothetical protein
MAATSAVRATKLLELPAFLGSFGVESVAGRAFCPPFPA